jgi:hypothetical protein
LFIEHIFGRGERGMVQARLSRRYAAALRWLLDAIHVAPTAFGNNPPRAQKQPCVSQRIISILKDKRN